MRKGQSRPNYSPEFKAETVRIARTSGKTQKELARELGMSDKQLRRWLQGLHMEDAGTARLAMTATEKAELKRLRKENALLREEQEILRKFQAFLAQQAK